MPTWTPEMLAVDQHTIHRGTELTHVLRQGVPLWHIVHGIGEQVLVALDELGHTGFKVKRAAVTEDGRYCLIHLDVNTVHPLGREDKAVPFVTLVSNKVVEQIRIHVTDMLDCPIPCWPDNHFWVRYIFDFSPLWNGAAPVFPAGEGVDYLDAIPGPLHIPLGLDSQGVLHWHDLRKGQHLLLTGATGAGKSTLMSAAIAALVRTTPPRDVRLAFIDGQAVNFKAYAQRLTDYEFTDADGALLDLPHATAAYSPSTVVSALVRLNHEHHRRLNLLLRTDWDNLEDYNAHVAHPDERLPYLVILTDELGLLREQLTGRERKTFDTALGGLLAGARKVGIRIVLCTQYLTNQFLPRHQASQAGLILAFQNSPQGSYNTLGDSEAALLRAPGRFIIEGLPEGRLVLQGLYIEREKMLDWLDTRGTRDVFPVDGLVQEVLGFVVEHLDGQLVRDRIWEAFATLLSQRQIQNFIDALAGAGLVRPGNPDTFPKEAKRLAVTTVAAACAVLQYHPEITFRELPNGRRVFGRA